MNSKSILINTSTFVLDAKLKLFLENQGYNIIFNPFKRKLTEEELLELINENVYGIIAGLEPIFEKTFAKASNLKVVSRCGIGLDNIDLKSAKRHNVKVFNTPNAPIDAVAELTITFNDFNELTLF